MNFTLHVRMKLIDALRVPAGISLIHRPHVASESLVTNDITVADPGFGKGGFLCMGTVATTPHSMNMHIDAMKVAAAVLIRHCIILGPAEVSICCGLRFR